MIRYYLLFFEISHFFFYNTRNDAPPLPRRVRPVERLNVMCDFFKVLHFPALISIKRFLYHSDEIKKKSASLLEKINENEISRWTRHVVRSSRVVDTTSTATAVEGQFNPRLLVIVYNPLGGKNVCLTSSW